MSVALEITVSLLEDMHAGSGLGLLGQIDSLQARDPQGNPVIRASTLRGVLRDTAEEWIRLLKACEVDTAADEERMHRLLGVSANAGERRAEAVFTSLRMQGGGKASSSPFLVWSSTARVHGGRKPKAGSLRQIEHARAGLEFRGTLTVPGSQDAEWMESCLRRVTAFGGRRSRGSGEIALKISRLSVANSAVPNPAPAGSPLRLLLRLDEPLNLARTGIAGNLIPTERHIPGPTLRGALLRWLAGEGERAAGLAARLGDDDGFSVSPGLHWPAAWKDAWRDATVVPLPLSLEASTTHKKSQLPWWAAGGEVSREYRDLAAGENPRDGKRWKRLRDEGSLVLGKGSQAAVSFPPVAVLMRNQVPSRRRQGAEDKADDALFTEEVLLQGELFLFEVAVPAGERQSLAEALSPLLAEGSNGSFLRIGRGSRPCSVVGHAWKEAPAVPSVPAGNRLAVTLVSHLLARTPWLAYATSLTPLVLARLARLAGADPAPFESLTLDKAWAESVPVSGWNRATRRQRAPAVAIRMGSVFQYSGPADALAKARESLGKIAALGERVGEGFGRFALDLAVHSAGVNFAGAGPEPGPAATDWREEVLDGVDRFVEANKARFKTISRSQWQAIRHQASAAADEAGLREGVWKPLEFHLDTRAGKDLKEKNVIPDLKEATERAGPDERQRYFLERAAAAFAAIAGPADRSGLEDQS